MSQVVVFCRRWVNWLREEAELSRDVRPSDFQHEFRIAKLHERWQADNAGISLYGYRHQLQQLACRSWQASGARVIQNELPGDAPHTVPLDPALLGELREASWVIPMD